MTAIQRNLCVLFADVSGSTRLYEKLGDEEALRAIGRCLERMERAVLSNRGRVIKTIGDEIMAVFDTAEAGMLAASDMQQRIDDLPPLAGTKMAIRVGFHFGPAIDENKDVFGDTVNVAARMAGLAKAGQIVTTETCVGLLPELLRLSTRDIDSLAVKGKEIDIRVHEVIWQENAELTMKSASIAPAAANEARVRLRHGASEIVLSVERPAVTLGRDETCDIVIRDASASRNHGKIERRRDKFMLVDISTNGTYVSFQGEPEFTLKREETILRGRGRIVFGHAWKSDADDMVEFVVES
ncbi:MAG: adenylate/guanylate cyclase domain-containing protein [Sulfuritalea sp.]|nr:adenylate/guanylate cyclase domain-containing protein [Sulfuritalea sp.]